MSPSRLLHRLASVLTWIFRRNQAEQCLDDEIRAFVEMAAAENVRDGIPPAEARRLALIELGGIEQAKERVRTGRHGGLLDEIGRDARYALRMFSRQRTFTVVIVLTLALGIGANTAIFSVIDSLLLRTLPVKQPERLAMLVASEQTTWTYPIWKQIEHDAGAFDGALAVVDLRRQIQSRVRRRNTIRQRRVDECQHVQHAGCRGPLGRVFTSADDERGGGPDGPVIVISHAFWQRHFGGARDVIGGALTIERTPFTIVGVTQAGFLGLNVGRSFDVAIPLGVEPLVRGVQESRLDRPMSWWLSVVVRLKPGQTIENGSTVFRTLQAGIREATLSNQMTSAAAAQYLVGPFGLIPAATGRSGLRMAYQRPLIVIMVVVALVLLMACANIANLLLARATARGHEWSVRLALGASRGRLARQLLVESLLLAVLGAAAGLLVASWGSQLLVAQLSSDAVTLDAGLNGRVLAFTAISAIIAALLFGIAPAWRATRGAPIDAMRDRGRGNTAGGRGDRRQRSGGCPGRPGSRARRRGRLVPAHVQFPGHPAARLRARACAARGHRCTPKRNSSGGSRRWLRPRPSARACRTGSGSRRTLARRAAERRDVEPAGRSLGVLAVQRRAGNRTGRIRSHKRYDSSQRAAGRVQRDYARMVGCVRNTRFGPGVT